MASVAVSAAPLLTDAKPKPQQDCDPTTLDYYGEGPFYTANAPLLTDGVLADTNEAGQRMIISGRVINEDCTEFIPNTIVDVWHADDAGAYDNNGYNLRGKVNSNEQGFYLFETIYPGKYLNGNAYRPAHIHFKITPPDHPTLTTQLYFEGDPDLESDAASSITSGTYDASNRIISLAENSEGVLEGQWDIVINGDGEPLGINDLHLNRGMIYQTTPNPFTGELVIDYGVFNQAQVGLLAYDIEGRLVAELENRSLTPGKYQAIWNPTETLPNGHYFVALKINEIQVHYLKVVKMA